MANNSNSTVETAVALTLGTFTDDTLEASNSPSFEASDFFSLSLQAGRTYVVDVVEEEEFTILPKVSVRRVGTQEEQDSGAFPIDGYPGEIDPDNLGANTGVGNNIRLFFTATETATHWFETFNLFTPFDDFGYAIRVTEDITDTALGAPALTEGDSFAFTSVLHSAADVDRFAVTLTAGQTYVFTFSGDAGEDPDGKLTLFQGSTQVTTTAAGSSRLVFTPTTSGSYSLAAAVATGGEAGAYALSMRAFDADTPGDATTTATIETGETISALLDPAGDVDSYLLTLQAGTTYTLALGADGSDLDTVLELVDASGKVVARNDDRATGDSDSAMVLRAVETTTFRITVADFASGAGEYLLSLTEGATAGLALRQIGGAAGDRLTGGSGIDYLLGRAGRDTLAGGDGSDTLVGGTMNDRVNGEAGNDQLFGDEGDDTVSGAAGNDFMFGGIGDDLLDGGSENDILIGQDGSDVLRGGAGSDRLTGGAGRDLLSGGAGKVTDVFVFSFATDSAKGKARDVIRDFQPGLDDIDLSFIDPDPSLTQDQPFLWGGTRATENGLWYLRDGRDVIVRFDVTGDGKADGEILLLDVRAVGQGNFVL